MTAACHLLHRRRTHTHTAVNSRLALPQAGCLSSMANKNTQPRNTPTYAHTWAMTSAVDMRPAASSCFRPAKWPCASATPATPRSSSQWHACTH
eukprot:1160814-Pelagomonas_calceolata.AAC.14